MRSVKRGRGPSAMNGIASVGMGLFGVTWMVLAGSMGAPWPFLFFGLIFVILAIVRAIYEFRNAGSANRYSEYDIVDGEEEPDPLNARFFATRENSEKDLEKEEGNFCPYCGARCFKDARFCSRCGKPLPGKGGGDSTHEAP